MGAVHASLTYADPAPRRMDAQDRFELMSQMESLLLAVGPSLRTRQGLFAQAAAIFASIVSNTPHGASSRSIATFNAGLDLCHDAAAPAAIPPPAAAPAPAGLPAWAAGKFPYNRPTPLLRDQVRQIEALLASLSDTRTRVHHIGLRLGGRRAAPLRAPAA